MSKILTLILLSVITSSEINAQALSDKELLTKQLRKPSEFENTRKVEYLFRDKNAFVKYNPVSLFFGGSLFLYQKFVSVQIGANCPYQVNCSNFSKQCIRKYGLLKGMFLTADRLTRCTKLAGRDLIPGVDLNLRLRKIMDNPDDYTFHNH